MNDSVDEHADSAVAGSNPIREIVDEISQCVGQITEQRESLRALGIPLRTTRTIVELGVQDQLEKQASVIDSALSISTGSEGSFAIDREELEERIAEIVQLERALTHTRTLARSQGFDAQILSFLTQIIEQNPGDGGAAMVNTFVDYARACGVEVDGSSSSSSEDAGASVLPNVARSEFADTEPNPLQLIHDAALGLIIGIGILWLVI